MTQFAVGSICHCNETGGMYCKPVCLLSLRDLMFSRLWCSESPVWWHIEAGSLLCQPLQPQADLLHRGFLLPPQFCCRARA